MKGNLNVTSVTQASVTLPEADEFIAQIVQDIPESGVSVRIAGVPIEVIQAEDRRIKNARIFRPTSPK